MQSDDVYATLDNAKTQTLKPTSSSGKGEQQDARSGSANTSADRVSREGSQSKLMQDSRQARGLNLNISATRKGFSCSVAVVLGLLLLVVVGTVSTALFRHPTGTSSSISSVTPTGVAQGTAAAQGTPVPQATQPAQVDVAGATSTIDTFCQFLNSGAIQWAYGLTSSTYQNQHGIDQFTNQFNNPDLIHGGCLHNRPTLSGNTVVVSLIMNRIDPTNGTMSSTNYTATLIRENNRWVIDSIV